MVDVIHEKCIYPGCKIIPNFNTPGEKARYCISHKLNNMIDVKNKICIHSGCKTRSSFNKNGEKSYVLFFT